MAVPAELSSLPVPAPRASRKALVCWTIGVLVNMAGLKRNAIVAMEPVPESLRWAQLISTLLLTVGLAMAAGGLGWHVRSRLYPDISPRR